MSEQPAEGGQRSNGRGFAGRMVEAVVAPFVQPVVDVVVAPMVQPVVDAVDVAAVVERIDINAVAERIDVDALLARVDVEALLDRIDPDALLDRVDPNRLLDRIDPDALLDRVDPNRLLDRVDADRLLARVDPDALLDRVDPNRLIERVDIDAVMARVDIDAVMARVDIDGVMARVDVNGLVKRTELGEIIARSTTGVFGQLIDTGRITIMSFDLLAHGIVARLLRRPDAAVQRGPGAIAEQPDLWRLPRADRAVALQGRYAGVISRFLAFLIDSTVVGALFGLIAALLATALRVVTDVDWQPEDHGLALGIAYAAWQFAYFAGLTAAAGRTVGKAVLGLFVVTSTGQPLGPRNAVLRTLAFPLSFLLFGIGFLLGLVRRDHRQLHDLLGGTAVVYDWDAEMARLRSSASTVSTVSTVSDVSTAS